MDQFYCVFVLCRDFLSTILLHHHPISNAMSLLNIAAIILRHPSQQSDVIKLQIIIIYIYNKKKRFYGVNRHSCVYIYKLSIDIKQYIYIYILNCYKIVFSNCYKKKRKKKLPETKKIKKETTVVCVKTFIFTFLLLYII